MNRQNSDVISIGLFLVGLGLLFLVGWFWPGILLLIGVVSMVNQVAKGEILSGLSSLVFFSVLTAVFSLGLEWQIVLPLALIAVGMLGLVRAVLRTKGR